MTHSRQRSPVITAGVTNQLVIAKDGKQFFQATMPLAGSGLGSQLNIADKKLENIQSGTATAA